MLTSIRPFTDRAVTQQPDSDQGNLKILLAMTFDALHERDPDAARQIVRFSEEAFGRDLFKTLP